jgi:hypothetical protein
MQVVPMAHSAVVEHPSEVASPVAQKLVPSAVSKQTHSAVLEHTN